MPASWYEDHDHAPFKIIAAFPDLNISKKILQKLLQEISEETFNSITVDGDTSTSDTVILSATGQAANKQVKNQISEEYLIFKKSLNFVGSLKMGL